MENRQFESPSSDVEIIKHQIQVAQECLVNVMNQHLSGSIDDFTFEVYNRAVMGLDGVKALLDAAIAKCNEKSDIRFQKENAQRLASIQGTVMEPSQITSQATVKTPTAVPVSDLTAKDYALRDTLHGLINQLDHAHLHRAAANVIAHIAQQRKQHEQDK